MPRKTTQKVAIVVVLVNTYKCANFQVPSPISYGDMEGVPE